MRHRRCGADSANDIIGFSSRGPTTDGRVKPEIVAPGTHVTGMAFVTPTSSGNATRVAAYRGDGVCGGVPPSITSRPGRPGTRLRPAPATRRRRVAGGAALVFQQFINNPPYLGAKRVPAGSAPPSPALVKAYMMNRARYMTGVARNDTLLVEQPGHGHDEPRHGLRRHAAGDP